LTEERPQDEETNGIDDLTESFKNVGPLRKVITTKYGLAAGENRKKAVPEWPEERTRVKDLYEHLKIKGADNVAKPKPAQWWRDLLRETANELLKQGVKPGEIVARLVKDFGLSDARMYKYLPPEFKDPKRAEAGRVGGKAKFAGTVLAKKQEDLMEDRKAVTQDLTSEGDAGRDVISNRVDISFQPWMYTWYKYAQAKGFAGDFNSFINACVAGYFRERGLALAVVHTKVLPTLNQEQADCIELFDPILHGAEPLAEQNTFNIHQVAKT